VKKRQLEQTLRAAGQLARDPEFFLIGSQAVHAYCRRPPAEVLLSRECDLYPKNHPQAAHLLDSKLGRRSSFARKHGFYADVVTPEIASLPDGWQRRLKPLRAGSVTALCLEVHDLAVSKLAAARLKDFEFVGALLKTKLANARLLNRRISDFPIQQRRAILRTRLAHVLADLRQAAPPRRKSATP